MNATRLNLRTPSRLGLALLAGFLVVDLFASLLTYEHLSEGREQCEEQASATTRNLAQLLDQNITGSVGRIDFALQAVADELQREDAHEGIRRERIEAFVARQKERLPEVSGIRGTDATGRVIWGTDVAHAGSVSYGDRVFFEAHRSHADSGLIVTDPIVGRVTGAWLVAFTRRYALRDGRFGGVISAAVPVAHFQRLLELPQIGSEGTAVLRDSHGGLIARNPPLPGRAGQIGDRGYSKELRDLLAADTRVATYHSLHTADGLERVDTFRRLSIVPFMLIIGQGTNEYLRAWRVDVVRDMALLCLFILVVGGATGLLWRGWKRQLRDDAALLESNRSLHEALAELDRRDASLLAVQEVGSLGTYSIDLGTGAWTLPARTRDTFGIGEQRQVGLQAWGDLVHPDDRREVLERLEVQIEERHELIDFECRVLRAGDGTVRWLHCVGRLEVSAAGRPLRLSGAVRDITQERQARLALEEEAVRRRIFFEQSGDGIVVTDGTGRVVEANERFAALHGYRLEEVRGLVANDWQRGWPRSPVPEAYLASAGAGSHYETVHVRKDGRPLDVEVGITEAVIDGRTLAFHVCRDISTRKRDEVRMRLAGVAFTNLQEAIIVTDEARTILDVNPAFTAITGYDREEALGNDPRMLQSGRQDKDFYHDMWQSLREYGRWEGEFWNRRKNGTLYVQHAKISVVRDADERITHYVCVASDVTQLIESQTRVEHLAYYDRLTNLPNRTLLADRMRQAILLAQRRQSLLGVCYLDLDGFKPVNDRWGHETGDQLLIEVARRLQAALRASDSVARLGGDEFVLLLCDCGSVREIEDAVRRVLAAVSAPCRIGPVDIEVSASVGITVYPRNGEDADVLIRHADQAMYSAKQSGKNVYRFFDQDSENQIRARWEMISLVEAGLAAGEFVLHYQPKADMRRGSVVGAEALLRWRHPDRGLLLPGEFLPVIDSSEFSTTLGDWVLRQALSQLAAWSRQGLVLPVSVNVSARQLMQPDFVAKLRRQLAEFPAVLPSWLGLEILETEALGDVDQVARIIDDCVALGLSVALDDFGTGYSSMSYFRRLAVDTLKIDQSFVRNMLVNIDDLTIVEGLVGLALTFGRRVVAEGVETIAHGIPLLRFGCDVAQGFAIAAPMEGAALPAWVRGWSAPAQWRAVGDVRWSREDLPLLLAESSHRLWVEQVVAICEGRAPPESAPPMESHHCRFGQWMYGAGRQRYGGLEGFVELERLHERVHALGVQLLAGDAERSAARLPELHSLRDRLVERIERLRLELERGRASAEMA